MTVLAPEPELAAAPTHDATARRGHPYRQGPHSTLALFQAKKWDFALLCGTDLLTCNCFTLPCPSLRCVAFCFYFTSSLFTTLDVVVHAALCHLVHRLGLTFGQPLPRVT